MQAVITEIDVDLNANDKEKEEDSNSMIHIEDDDEQKEEKGGKKVSALTMQLLHGLCVVLDYMYREDKRYAPDYRVVILKENTNNFSFLEASNGFRRKRKPQEMSQWTFSLNFWCLNPAVAFGDFAVAKSVILTSGTLSPLLSFESELGLKFDIKFEANHVINMNQVWAGAIGCGPQNVELTGTYNVVNTWAYQDDLGEAILRICKIVPKGVLCFFSSYTILNNLMNRWQVSVNLPFLSFRTVYRCLIAFLSST